MGKKKIYGIKREIIFMAIALIIMGAVFVIFPAASAVTICYIIVAALCVWGITRLAGYFRTSRFNIFGSYGLVQGAVLIAGGIFIFIKPEFLAGFIVTIIGIIMLADGVLKIQYAVDLLRIKGQGWWIILLTAIIMAAAGIVVLFNPFASAVALMTFAGIFLIADGIADIVSLLYISRKINRLKKAMEEKADDIIDVDFVEK